MSLIHFLKSKTFAKHLAIAVGITIVLIFAALQWLDSTTNHGQEITVPNLSKMTVQKAAQELEQLELQYEIIDTVDYKSDFPSYSIVQQDPLPNVTVKEDRKVYIKLNAGGYNDVTVPELIQKTLRQAEPTIKSAGLEMGEVTYKPYLAKDIVLEVLQNGKKLKAGDKVKKASKIDLVLGDGKAGFDDEENNK